MGVPEQPWETYDLIKQRVVDTVAALKGISNDPANLEEAQKVEISYCNRVGKQTKCESSYISNFSKTRGQRRIAEKQKEPPSRALH